MKGVAVLRFGMSRVVWFSFQTLYLRLTLDGSEDILDQELQQGESVVCLVGSALLRLREWFLLERALSASLDIDRGVSILWLRFCSVIIAVERWVCGVFIATSNFESTGSCSNEWHCTSPNVCTVGGWPIVHWWMWGHIRLFCNCVLWLANFESSQCTSWGCQRVSS